MPGAADRSYGIEVGRLAGLPAPVIARARALLRVLEGEQLVPALGGVGGTARRATPSAPTDQLGLFAVTDPLVERLKGVDPNALTPLQALSLLADLAAEARGRS